MIDILLFIAGLAGFIVSAIYTFKNKISFFKGICLGTLSFLVPFIIGVFLEKTRYGVSPIDMALELTFTQLKAIAENMPEELASALSHGETYEVFKATLLNRLQVVRQIYIMIYPAIIITTYAMTVFFLYMIIKTVMRLFKKDVSFIPCFNCISLNKATVLGYVISLVMAFLLADTFVGNAFANLQFIFSSYVILCGISLIDYLAARRIRIGFVRFLMYIPILLVSGAFVGIVIQIAAFMAVFDAFRSFRSDKSRWV